MANYNRQPRKNDVQELENAFHSLSDKNNRRGSSRKNSGGNQFMPYLIIGACLLVIGIIIGSIFMFNASNDTPSANDVISAKLTIGGVNIEGMTYQEAEQAITKVFEEKYGKKDFSVAVDGLDVSIPHSLSKTTLDTEKLMQAISAYKYSSDQQELNLKDYVSVSKESITKVITDLLPRLNLTLVPSTYEVIGTPPESYDAIDETVSMALKITKGTPGKTVNTEELTNQIIDSILQETWKLEYASSTSDPEPLDFAAIQTQHGALPVEASFEDKTFKVLGGTYGYNFDIEEANKALDELAFGESIQIAFAWTEPETTAEELAATLFCDELASYSTHAGSNYDRNINLKLAAEAINGVILYPGDVFSYNGTLGERTPEKGYRPGASYVGGQTVYDYGGGICQVSSSLYYCTILADLEIVERWNHAYASSYTPLSTDATVFWGGVDFRFKNNWNYPIRIDAHTEYGNVYVSLYGTDEKDYYVKFESEWLNTYPYETKYQDMEEDNEKGFKDGDVITTPYTGYKSKGYRAYYDKETGELIERVLESTDIYDSRDKVICRIEKEEENPDVGGDGGSQTPPVDGGETPPVDGGGETPPVDGGGETPPVDGGGETPPVDGGDETPPAGNETEPVVNGDTSTPE